MSYNKSIDSSAINTDLTTIANAIRAKTGGSTPLVFPSGFVSEINNIPAGGGTDIELVKENANIAFSNTDAYTGDSLPLTTPLVAGDVILCVYKSSGFTLTNSSVSSRANGIGYSAFMTSGTGPSGSYSYTIIVDGSIGSTSLTPYANNTSASIRSRYVVADVYVLHLGNL